MRPGKEAISNQRKARATRLMIIYKFLPIIRRLKFLARQIAASWEKQMRENAHREIMRGEKPPGAIRDRLAIGLAVLHTVEKAVLEDRLSSSTTQKLLNVLLGEAIIKEGDETAKSEFEKKYGTRPPSFLLISPTKKCNLYCPGCYADSDRTEVKLSWPLLDRAVGEARRLWGARFLVISGGEPLLYQDEGKGILDLVEKYEDCFFLMYTNGTLINQKVAQRMAEIGNIMPAVSVEGLKETTEKRRGPGVFSKILQAFEHLSQAKVFYGISITITRNNAYEAFSDEVIDLYFHRLGAYFAWAFQYMPIGRAFTLELLPTPEQRLWLWKRAWQLVREKHIFLIDFWNSGTATHGCVSAGRSGGYIVINWDGTVTPCVFIPYSPVNLYEAYGQGKDLNDIWANPFFADIRKWQIDYGYGKNHKLEGPVKNWIRPCPIRDHFEQMYNMLQKHHPRPIDDNASEALLDPEYYQGLADYDRQVAALLDPIWEKNYL